MTVFTNEEMIRLHHFIRCHGTGTPRVLAKKLGCSKRKVHYLIERMRDDGLPVAWDDRRQSYYYEVEVNIQFSVTIGDKELMRIRGGNSVPQNIFEKNGPVQAVCTHSL